MRILVIGASGYLGTGAFARNVRSILVRSGYVGPVRTTGASATLGAESGSYALLAS